MQVHFTHIETDLLLTFRHNIPDLFGDKVIGNWQEFIFSIPAGGRIFSTVVPTSPVLVGIQEVTEIK